MIQNYLKKEKLIRALSLQAGVFSFCPFFFFFFFTVPVECANSRARDQTHATAATQVTAVSAQ
ncbi:hypothetical protein ACJBXQ_11540, partial [Streptococcus suis]